MNPVKVRNLEIGTGIPKICVPIVEKTKKAVLEAADRITETKHRSAEWRVDWYEDASDFSKIKETLEEMRGRTGGNAASFYIPTLRKEAKNR